MYCRREQKGMTLLEVVVSMLIIGLGMTASIAMLQTSMSNNVSALNRNNALYLSEAMIDKMRMNKFAARQYLYQTPSEIEIDKDYSKKSIDKGDCTYCKSAEAKENAFVQASKDVNIWQEELRQKLPGADFSIYAVNEDKSRYGIKIVWPNTTKNYVRIKTDHSSTGSGTNNQLDELVTIFTL